LDRNSKRIDQQLFIALFSFAKHSANRLMKEAGRLDAVGG